MASGNIKKKRVSRQYYVFFLACFASLLGLLVYILGAKIISFPHQWIPNINKDIPDVTLQPRTTRLFFAGVSVHLGVNFVLQFFYIFLNPNKTDQVKLKK